MGKEPRERWVTITREPPHLSPRATSFISSLWQHYCRGAWCLSNHKSQLCRVPTIPGRWDKIQRVGNAGGLKHSYGPNSTCSFSERQLAGQSSLPMDLPDINASWKWRGWLSFLTSFLLLTLRKCQEDCGSWEVFLFEKFTGARELCWQSSETAPGISAWEDELWFSYILILLLFAKPYQWLNLLNCIFLLKQNFYFPSAERWLKTKAKALS